MRETLHHLIELSGLSKREVERRLREQSCGTDLGRLLSGRLDLKVAHVLAVCRVIELEPMELFQMALKPRPGHRSPLLSRLEALLPRGRADAEEPERRPQVPGVHGLLRQAQEMVEKLGELIRAATPPHQP